MSYATVGATNIAGGVAAVDCQKQVRSWRLLRSLVELLIPTCNCVFIEETEIKEENYIHTYYCPQRSWVSSTIVTGTIFGYRRGKVSFCIQTNPKSTNPLLLLELAVPTTRLSREMRCGTLRIAIECTTRIGNNAESYYLLSMPVWTMYCNGRKVGFAVKRKPSEADTEVLQKMESIIVGAGTISGKEFNFDEDEIMYLRGNFESLRRSSNSQSFHLIDSDGGQELSIFFLERSE